MGIRKWLYLCLIITLVSCSQKISNSFLFVGSLTDGVPGDGIHVYEFNYKTAELTEVHKQGDLINSSFLTISPNGKNLYSVTESRMEYHGTLSSFSIDSTSGKITFLNKQTTGGRNPVHAIVNNTNEHVIVSNFTDSGISIFECEGNGSLKPYSQLLEFAGSSVTKGRQDESHLHSSNFNVENDFLFSPDLGTDHIRVLSYDSENLLEFREDLTVKVKEGKGPRHFAFHPSGKYAYCLDEISGSVTAYTHSNGKLNEIGTYQSYKIKQEQHSSADIHVSPDGKHLYASNRQEENSIAIFAIDQKNGHLTLQGHHSTLGSIPRSFLIDPTGKYVIVANRVTNNIIVLKRNTKTGLLAKTGTEIKVSQPASIKMRNYK